MNASVSIDTKRPDQVDRRLTFALYLQVAMVVFALVALILAPPRKGPMLVIPLGRSAIGQTMNWALPEGAAFLGQGPLPGSILVYARRDRLAGAAWQHASLLIKAPEMFCGEILDPQRSK